MSHLTQSISNRITRVLALASLAGACVLASGSASAQDVAAGGRKAGVCTACHGAGGNSTQGQYPILAGQSARYLYLQLVDFKEARRVDPQMQPFAANLSRADMLDLSAYFAAQKPLGTAFKPDPKKAALGEAKAQETLCTMCHLGGFKGQNEIPRVGGQHYDYIVKQLRDFKAKRRTNDAGSMTSVSGTLSDGDILNLGHFLAGLH